METKEDKATKVLLIILILANIINTVFAGAFVATLLKTHTVLGLVIWCLIHATIFIIFTILLTERGSRD